MIIKILGIIFGMFMVMLGSSIIDNLLWVSKQWGWKYLWIQDFMAIALFLVIAVLCILEKIKVSKTVKFILDIMTIIIFFFAFASLALWTKAWTIWIEAGTRYLLLIGGIQIVFNMILEPDKENKVETIFKIPLEKVLGIIMITAGFCFTFMVILYMIARSIEGIYFNYDLLSIPDLSKGIMIFIGGIVITVISLKKQRSKTIKTRKTKLHRKRRKK
ncbi:MAG: hypothetical protein A2231_10960 [Candidatus Firestonebacteria bacterium RIFOXYA2_FULL_40_8]|nr:MAG: hypothetical protein A2231_10960 [Candidatus Firestonebacteria bacterium RIFOXYA2_FULL_40_8]